MRVQLSPNEEVHIVFEGADGAIKVIFSTRAGIIVESDLPDREGRVGTIYHDPWEYQREEVV